MLYKKYPKEAVVIIATMRDSMNIFLVLVLIYYSVVLNTTEIENLMSLSLAKFEIGNTTSLISGCRSSLSRKSARAWRVVASPEIITGLISPLTRSKLKVFILMSVDCSDSSKVTASVNLSTSRSSKIFCAILLAQIRAPEDKSYSATRFEASAADWAYTST